MTEAPSQPSPGLARCDFCSRMLPAEVVATLPCADYTLVAVNTPAGVAIACQCHPPAGLDLARAEGEALAVTGAWAACRECRTDVERGRWDALLSRALASIPAAADRQHARTVISGQHQMFAAHRQAPAAPD